MNINLLAAAGILFLLIELGLRMVLYLSRRGTGRYKLEYLLYCPVSWTNRYSKTNYYQSHPFLSYTKKDNCDSIRYPSNSLGFAGRKEIDPKNPRGYRIYVCGDSSVEQNDYDMISPFDPELTWPSVMETELEKMTGTPVEVINAGVSAYTSIESLIDFQLKGLPLKPDMAIFHQNLTDAWLCQSVAGFKPDYSHNRKSVCFEQGIHLPDIRVSYVYQYLKMRLSSGSGALISYLVKNMHFKSNLELTEEHFSTYRNNLRSFCALSVENGIIPVLSLYCYDKDNVTSPLGHDLDDNEIIRFIALFEKNNEIIREVCREFSQALLLDPGRFDGSQYRTGDWMHWSKQGIQAMGKRAAEGIVETVKGAKEHAFHESTNS
ncbi:hypothetical protein [Mariprofundus sp. KV]|uniref:hypothetical protein n=1 Tax=Mariprofundus sp. KV TaxID=2608715 RepID=UPI0015A481A8|nr:hypothetical protein [Mariprofundus sp. KV]